MSTTIGKKHKAQDGSSSQADTEENVNKKKRKIANLNIMYMFTQGSESHDTESVPLSLDRKKSGEVYVEEQTDQETPTKKKKRKETSHMEADAIMVDDSSSSIVHKIKKSQKAKDAERLNGEHFTEEAPCDQLTDLEGRSKKRKKKPKKDHKEQVLDDILVEETATVELQHAKKKKKKQKDDGGLQDDGFPEEHVSQRESSYGTKNSEQVDESVEQPETVVKKKKTKKRKDEPHQEADDITAEVVASSSVLYQEKNEKKKKSHKAKDPKGHHRVEGLPEEADIKERPSLIKKKGHLLDGGSVEELLTTNAQHIGKKKTKQKDGGDESHEQRGVTEEVFTKIKHHGASETTSPEHKDESVEQEEKSLKKKKKKRKDNPHQKSDGIVVDDVSSSVGLCRDVPSYIDTEEKPGQKKKKKSNKDSSGEELLNHDAQHKSKKKKKTKKKDGDDENNRQNGVTETTEQEVEIEQPVEHVKKKKKKKKQKGGEGLQEDGFTEELFTPKKSSASPEHEDESAEQEENPIKKKKRKRKEEPDQESDDITVVDVSSSVGLCGDDLSYIDMEEKPGHKKKKKKSKKDSSVEELFTHDVHHTSKKTKRKDGEDENSRQHGVTETTEQELEIVDQAEEHVKKKKKSKKKKHSDRTEETSEILTNENVEADEEEDAEQQRRPQTSTNAGQEPTTQDERAEVQDEEVNRPGTSRKSVGKQRECKPISVREEDLALLQEFLPQKLPENAISMRFMITNELERIRIAKQKGIVFRRGKFTIEEDEQIKKNVEAFMFSVGIPSATMLFHPYIYPEHSKAINQLKRKFHFQHRIAEGLPRLLKDVAQRGSKLFHFATSKGRYTEEEVRHLEHLYELHGNNWKDISVSLNRSRESSMLKLSQVKQDGNTGAWSLEETNRLITAVKEFVLEPLERERNKNEDIVTIPKRMLYKGIKWVQIQELVETRNWTHCKIHWSDIICIRMNDGLHPFKGELGMLSSIKMIKWMYDARVREFGDIIWDDLCDNIGNCTSFCAQLHFIRLKSKIKGFKKLRLYEIVDRLHKETLPELEAKLSASMDGLVEPEIKDEFPISKMFREYTDYDADEDMKVRRQRRRVGGEASFRWSQ